MGLMARIVCVVIFLLINSINVEAAWLSPIEVVAGVWGRDSQQFGINYGDTEDTFPSIEAITVDEKIVISDSVNKKQIVFDINGKFVKEIEWIVDTKLDQTTYFNIYEYSFGPIVGYSIDGNIYVGSENQYELYSNAGKVINTYTKRPKELGVINEKLLSNGQYKVTITYPDKLWTSVGEGICGNYMRDKYGFLHCVGQNQIVRYDGCGKEITRLTMPEKNIERIASSEPGIEDMITMLEEYGSPVLAFNGDVYASKRTPTTYSILKWTWVDSPDDPKGGPDAPVDLKVIPSTDGLSLTWTASPQDPGCVEGYEVERSSTSGGIFSNITTTAPGVVKYNDTGAFAGSSYYYRIRAKSSCGPSPYTAEVSGKRP